MKEKRKEEKRLTRQAIRTGGTLPGYGGRAVPEFEQTVDTERENRNQKMRLKEGNTRF